MSYGTVQAEKVTTESGYSLGAGNASSFKNRIINGGMVIDQRNAGASVTNTTSNLFTLDRWECYGTVASKFTVQQNAGSVTPPADYTNYLGVTSSSAYSIGSGDVFRVTHKIEGYNVSDLNWGGASAKSVTMSFWIRSSLTGTFGGSVTNSSQDRSYPFTYTINSANTWEQKTITIPGDTSGSWLKNTGIGIWIIFSLGSGSTYSASANSWTSTTYINSATGATSLVGTNGATWYITGVQFEVGTVATSFDFRSYGTELALCQRYCLGIYANGVNSGRVGVGWYTTTTQSYVLVPTPVTMRDPANISVSYGAFSDYDLYSGGTPLAPTSIGFDRGSQIGISLAVGVASGGTVGGVAMLLFKTTTARITLSCEL